MQFLDWFVKEQGEEEQALKNFINVMICLAKIRRIYLDKSWAEGI